MRTLLLLFSMLTIGVAAGAEVIVFVDGTRMEIRSYEVQEGIVLFTTVEGKLRSVPRSYVNLVATEQINRGGGQPSPAPARPAPPPPRPEPSAPAPPRAEIPTESIEPEPVIPAPTPPPPPPATPSADLPPPVWSNDELRVSLVVPSAAWRIEDMPPSFDVAVALTNEATEARATLALIRQRLRNEGDFRDVVRDVERSISQAPGYRAISAGPFTLDPYVSHEFRFVKTVGFVPVYNRLVIVYSRDLAYVLSLTCPESRLSENDADFETLVRGLVLKKSRGDLTF